MNVLDLHSGRRAQGCARRSQGCGLVHAANQDIHLFDLLIVKIATWLMTFTN
jgi:hypothetical protein